MHTLRHVAAPCAAAFAMLAVGPAQDHLHWKTWEAAPGPRSFQSVHAHTWWDPDGAGPRAPVLVVGGSFDIPSIGARNLAWFDPATRAWSAFADQPNLYVNALATLANGDLAVGGGFTAIGPTPAGYLAIWNGTSWTSPQGGCSGGSAYSGVAALVAMPNGDLVAGGTFTHAGGVAIGGIARWDGSVWHSFAGVSIQVTCMAQRSNGNLIVGGVFPGDVAEWNGVGWSVFAGGIGTYPQAVAVLANGDVIVSGGAYGLARWTGTAWSSITGNFFAPRALLPLANGDLLAEVTTMGSTVIEGIGRWDGQQWTAVTSMRHGMRSLTVMPNGDLCAMGSMQSMTGQPINSIATWNGVQWSTLADGFDNSVDGLLPAPNGDLLVFGRFRNIGTSSISSLARRTASGWAPVPLPVAGTYGSNQIVTGTNDGNGDLWAASGSNVFRWTGAAWQGVGTLTYGITSMVVDPTGQPIVGSATYQGAGHRPIQRWNGTAWAQLGLGLDAPVRALLQLDNGDLVAGGEFLASGATAVSRIARWSGATWQPVGPGLDGAVRALAKLPNGDLVAAGDFWNDGTLLRPLPLIARWDGTAWQPLGAGLGGSATASVTALHVLPNGDLLAGGSFTTAGGYPIRGLARWNGASWSAVDGGVDGPVSAITRCADGEVWICGDFARVGGRNSAHVAVLRTDRPASAVVRGSGCGPLVLSATALPWLGAEYRSRCTGVPPTAIGLELLSLTPVQLPLSSLHPAATPGCELLASPGFGILRMPTNGTIVSSIAIPHAPSLLGVQLFEQVLVGVFQGGALARLLSSNGLTLTCGTY